LLDAPETCVELHGAVLREDDAARLDRLGSRRYVEGG
jgi:hypothetical protein